MDEIKRYTWEDSLIQAAADGEITARAAFAALRLAKAINWKPVEPRRKGRPGLYWKNETACEDVGLARSTFYRANKELKEAGYLELIGGNLLVRFPDEYQPKTSKSR